MVDLDQGDRGNVSRQASEKRRLRKGDWVRRHDLNNTTRPPPPFFDRYFAVSSAPPFRVDSIGLPFSSSSTEERMTTS